MLQPASFTISKTADNAFTGAVLKAAGNASTSVIHIGVYIDYIMYSLIIIERVASDDHDATNNDVVKLLVLYNSYGTVHEICVHSQTVMGREPFYDVLILNCQPPGWILER